VESLLSGLPDLTIEVVEVRDPGDLTVAALDNRALWLVGEWRARKVIWWQTFRAETEALDAVRPRE
jgi:hypothetical protein